MAGSAKKEQQHILKGLAENASLRGTMKDTGAGGRSDVDLDTARRTNMAYEYLCHLEEAKKWMEACLKIDLPPASELESALQNGVFVAKLATFFAPDLVKQKHIYDYDESVYKEHGLRFRHTDNIARWTGAMKAKGFPEIFYPEVTDLYDRKNMPRVIYCIHALSRYLYQLGIAPKIQDLHGIAQFTDAEIQKMDEELAKAGVQMPTFGSIGGVLAKELGQDTGTLEGALAEIQAAIEAGDRARLLAALRVVAAGISGVEDDPADLYLDRLKALLGKGELTQDSVQAVVRDVNKEYTEQKHLSAITAAVQHGSADELLAALRAAPWGLVVDADAAGQYLAQLRAALAKGPLTPAQVRSIVDDVNAAHRKQQAEQAALAALNAAVDGGDALATLAALRAEALGLVDVDEAGAFQYQAQLKAKKDERAQPLTRADAQECITTTNAIAEENAKHAAAIFALHEAVRQKSVDRTLAALQDPYCHVVDVRPACARGYLDNLAAALAALEAEGARGSKWKQCTAPDGRTYYYNEETKVTQWVAPIEEVVMTLEQVQDAVDRANGSADRWAAFQAKEASIVQLQAHIRGALARRAFLTRLHFLRDQEGSVRKIQAHVKGHQQRQRYKSRLQYFRDHVDAVVKLQAAWKGMRARRQYKNLTKVGDPPVSTVKRFLHLLDQSDADLAEELAVQQLKERVVLEIKQNVQLEHDLNQMDIKIGLLVKNRISLEDVVKQSKVLKRQQRQGTGSQPTLPVAAASNINALNKDSRKRLESYQHLFYLLQTQPIYLARLIFVDTPLQEWTANKAQGFLQKITETVYNLGSNAREQYLLFKLFRTALYYEVEEKIQSPRDFITGNPTVVKLVMAHHRGQNAGNYLASTLGPFVKRLLAEEEPDLSLDPVEVYRSWLSKQEMTTGEKSALPYDVTREVALEQPAVRAAMDALSTKMLGLCSSLLDSIVQSVESLPYGLRSICKELFAALRKRFPREPQDDLLKVVGNLLYYRYMNPALIAPEAFDVIEGGAAADALTPLHRKGLGSVAKIMQFAASGQVFEEEGESPLNAFLRAAWARFKGFFEAAAGVPSLEEYYHIDEYSEAVLLTRPVIVISFHDMYWLYRMVGENLGELAPQESDPLRVIAADLGPVGDEKAELGEEESPEYQANKTEMSLTLVNKFEVPEQDDASVKALFVRTKRLVVDVIRFRSGKSLLEVLSGKPTAEEEAAYALFVDRRKKEHEKAKRRATEEPDRPQPPPPQIFGSLAELMERANANIQQLVQEKLCTPQNNYQDLLNAVAQDIRNQRIYRRQRKQELARLNSTVVELRRKQQYYTQTISEYESYVGECMKHMGVARPRRQGMMRLFRSGSKEDTSGKEDWVAGRVVKYSAARLKEKGVVISVDGATDAQLKHITLEIATTKDKGVFDVTASAVMLSKTRSELLLEDLLQLQYQNIPTMKLFDACVVNVNLLLFLINKKLLGGSK